MAAGPGDWNSAAIGPLLLCGVITKLLFACLPILTFF